VTTIIGVDPSITSTGLVTWRNGRIFVATVATHPAAVMAQRHHDIAMRILTMAERNRANTLVVMEGRIKPGDDAVNTALDLAELRGVINHALHVQGIARVDVHPMTLKVFATGNGRALKSDMTVAARNRLGQHLHVTNDDEADAAFLLAMALHHYRLPLCTTTDKQAMAAERAPWPPFTLDVAQ